MRRFARSLDGFARSTDIVARQGGDDFVLVIPLLDDLTDEGRAAIAESIDRRLKKLFAPEPDPEGPEPDPSLRIKQLRANYEAYTAQRAEYMARLANGQDAGEEPRLANVPMAPLASIGVAMGRIVPEEPGYEPGAPNHNYHALFNQAVVNEKAHKQEMVDKKILNPRPTAIVADESPAPAADHPVEQP